MFNQLIMKNLSVLLLLFLLSFQLLSQNGKEYIEGRISFISSQNVYVKFSSTERIEPGDSLYKKQDGVFTPVLKVRSKSSISCVGEIFGNEIFQTNEPIYAFVQVEEKQSKKVGGTKRDSTITTVTTEVPIKEKIVKPKPSEQKHLYGRLSAASYSSYSKEFENSFMRMRYTLSLNYLNIGNSKLSAETYINFSHKTKEWDIVKDNVFSGLKIYNLNLNYNFKDGSYILAGRKINRELSSVGAIDGIQAQKDFKSVNIGGFVGYRPDYLDYSFNFNMLQYGGYLVWKIDKSKKRIRNTFAFIEQQNNKLVDRRFVYFQHNSTFKKLYLFASLEAELYKLVQNQAKNSFDLSSLYVYSRYRFSPKVSLSASYDARKNIIYYETFKTLIDSIFESEVRQGYRLRLNYRPGSKLSMGLSGGYRFRISDTKPSANLNAYLFYNKLPIWDINVNLSATYLQSSYLNAGVYGIRFQKSFFEERLSVGLQYRLLNGRYSSSELKLNQNSIETSLNWRLKKKMYLSLDYEIAINSGLADNRLYFRLSKKF